MYFDMGPAALQQSAGVQPQNTSNRNPVLAQPIPGHNPPENDLRRRYREFLQHREGNDDMVNPIPEMMKSSWGFVKGFFVTPPGGARFIEALNKAQLSGCGIQFRKDRLRENLAISAQEHRPLLVILAPVSTSTWAPIVRLLKSREVCTFITQRFVCLGLLAYEPDIEGIQIDWDNAPPPVIHIYRRNLLEEPVLLETYSMTDILGQGEGPLRVRLNQALNTYTTALTEENRIRREVQDSLAPANPPPLFDGLYEFQDDGFPMSPPPPRVDPAVQLAREQDRLLRAQQEASYQEMIAKARHDEERKTKEEEEKKVQLELAIQKEREEEERRAIRMSLVPNEPTESDPEAVLLVLRLPEGSKLLRRFYPSNTLRELYCFLESTKEMSDIPLDGYEVVVPHPFKLLTDDEQLTLDEVFEGSKQETLHVREKA
eukprot:TRINITY_DN7468_c0_g1_i1.p1 TRINITY_DN7468_c0_g1~~TRINITY_DN7468_c0_g1_i1.p1  ORF type:complete len:430 (-),score=105.29 TRINITY_DN7468_c0_g1_i1:99-1388(-)